MIGPIGVVLMLSVTGLANSIDIQESFVKANLSYNKGNYQEAIEHYDAILSSGVPVRPQGLAQLHYNFGNAYLRDGKLGASIASYLTSAAQDPRNEDLLANLEFARSQTKDALEIQQPNPIVQTLAFWHFAFGRSQGISLLLWANTLFWLLWSVRLFYQGSALLRWSQQAMLCCAVLLAGSVGIRWGFPTQIAVVQQDEISVYAGQDTASVVRFKLHEGSETRVVQVDKNWVKIDLPQQKQGWVRSSEVRVVSL